MSYLSLLVWLKPSGIGTNVCHAGRKGHVSYLRFKKEQKGKNMSLYGLSWNNVEHFTIAMLGIANFANSHVSCFFKLKTLSAVKW